MNTISFIGLNDCLASSISLPLEMLNAADNLQRSRRRKRETLTVNIATVDAQPIIETAGGLNLMANCSVADIKHSDLIILPALWRNPLKTIHQHDFLLSWLRQMHAAGSIICAVGTSSCYLAEAGLLDDKPATTHWYFCDQFKQHYPNVNLKPEYLITQADNLYCAGSVNSVADLMVHLIENHYSPEIARGVESQFSPEIRRSFSSHAYAEDKTNLHSDELIIQAQEWLQQHSDEAININQFAASLGLGLRTFNRRFKQAAGVTASEYLLSSRINTAKDLLRTSNLSIAEVAEQTGFLESSYFCARFKKMVGQTPLSYRKSVRGKLFTIVN